MKITFFLFFLITSPLTFAAKESSCKRVILQREKWGDLQYKNMPVYDQGQLGICYSYAAIQLIDYWRKTNFFKKGVQLALGIKNMPLSSPFFGAYLQRKQAWGLFSRAGRRNIERGLIEDVINAVRKGGMCRIDIVNQGLNTMAKKYDIPPETLVSFTHQLLQEYNEQTNFFQRLSNKSPQKFVKKYLQRKFKCSGPPYQGICVRHFEVFSQFYPLFKKNNYISFLDEAFKDCYKPNGKYPWANNLPRPKKYKTTSAKKFQKKLIELLTRPNPQPIAVGYCSKFLRRKNYIGKNRIGFTDPDCGPHASIVIGMRERNQKCEFMIRNSWGNSCKDYVWDCEYTRGRARSEGHGIWVDGIAFTKNILNITWLE
tara:strand:- start:120 stop:1232 length:1113 start_codon:yes stop_codon:yes gene_type:complete